MSAEFPLRMERQLEIQSSDSQWPTGEFYLVPEACAAAKELQPGDARYVDFRRLRQNFSSRKFQNWLTAEVRASKHMKRCFCGHRGSGKTTELYQLRDWANHHGFLACYIDVTSALGSTDIHAADLLLLAITSADDAVRKVGISVDPRQTKRFIGWLSDVTKATSPIHKSEIAIEIENQLEAEEPRIGPVMARIQAGIRAGTTHAQAIRSHLRNCPELLVRTVNELLRAANAALLPGGRRGGLLMLFDSLDRYDTPMMERVLFAEADLLQSLECHALFTMPLALAYAPRKVVEYYGQPIILPVLALRKRTDGWADTVAQSQFLDDRVTLVREGVRKRLLLAHLFENLEDADLLVKMSGGCLRDLMQLICEAFSEVMEGERITSEAVRRSISTLRNDYVRQLMSDDYNYLAEIARSKRLQREDDKPMIPERHPLHCGYALEYLDDNGEQWVDVHPLIVETDGFRRAYRKREALRD